MYSIIFAILVVTVLHTVDSAVTVNHDEYETMAQSICTSMAIKDDKEGWTYAVKRKCDGDTSSCESLCVSNIRNQDPQTKEREWSTLGAIHVYPGRPASSGTSPHTSTLGLKVYWSTSYHTGQNCGSNFCCCHAKK